MMFLLVVKATVLFGVGLTAFVAMRRSTAAARHAICACTLAGSLLLPLAALLPSKSIAIPLAVFNAVAAGSSPATHAGTFPWSAIALTAWILGTLLMLTRLAVGYRRVSKLAHSSADVGVPIATGLLRPKVLMPRAANQWPEWLRTAVLRHEAAHIERKDLWANFAANLACSLYWFHPLVWVISARMYREQEVACDDAVLQSGFDPATYAEALLAVSRNAVSQNSTSTPLAGFLPGHSIGGCAMTTQTNLKQRIVRLLDSGIARRTSRAALLGTGIAFALMLATVAGLNPVRAQSPYKVGGDVLSPRIISKVEPAYTEEARAAKISGTVTLSMVIGTDGLAHDITVTKSLDPGLDRSAAETIGKWKFAPGTLKGEPVPVEAVIEVNFRLE